MNLKSNLHKLHNNIIIHVLNPYIMNLSTLWWYLSSEMDSRMAYLALINCNRFLLLTRSARISEDWSSTSFSDDDWLTLSLTSSTSNTSTSKLKLWVKRAFASLTNRCHDVIAMTTITSKPSKGFFWFPLSSSSHKGHEWMKLVKCRILLRYIL